jgi:serine/threonine-protein kinase
MPCPDDAEFTDFIERRLPKDRELAIERHVDGCTDCLQLFAQLARLKGLETSPLGEAAEELTAPGNPRLEPQPTPVSDVGRTVGRYQLTAILGEGGMGRVYAAEDSQLGRRVAVKLLRPDARSSARAAATSRLFREAQAQAQVRHPHVVQVFDVGLSEGEIFIVMELVDGEPANRWCRQRPWAEVVRVFIGAGQGLAAVHAAGLIHRDFKPQNVLVAADGSARLVDFGIARVLGDEQLLEVPTPDALRAPLVTNGTSGTPAFMAPEQRLGAVLDARADQFSFCQSLWTTLYGKLATPVALEPQPPRAEVPLVVHQALLRGLSVRPEGRFPSMVELLDELSAAVAPPSTLSRAVRRVRGRVGTLGVMVAVSALVLGLVVAVVTTRPPAASSRQLGLDALWHHELNVARERLLDAAAMAPNDVPLLMAVAWMHYWFDDEELALEANRHAQSLSAPADLKLGLQAQAAMIRGELALSRTLFQRLVDEHPDVMEYHYGLFETSFHLGHLQPAVDEYLRVRKLRADVELGIDHLFDVYAARRDEGGLNGVVQSSTHAGLSAPKIRKLRGAFALGRYDEVITTTSPMLEGVFNEQSLYALLPFSTVRLQALLVEGQLGKAREHVARAGSPVDKVALALLGKSTVLSSDLGPLLPREAGRVTDAEFPNWIAALTLALPSAEAATLKGFSESSIAKHSAGLPRASVAQVFLARADASSDAPARLSTDASVEVKAAARAVLAEREENWNQAAREWDAAWHGQAGGAFGLLEAFARAQAGRRAHDDDVVLDGCDKVIEPRAFHWSWVVTAPLCLDWVSEILERRGESPRAARLRELLRRLQLAEITTKAQ